MPPAPSPLPELTPRELQAELERGKALVILDVREPFEYNIARLPGAVPIPLGELPARLGELDRNAEIVCQCKMGGRSARATMFLLQQGYKARNLKGGILAWSDEVDPTVPKY